MSLDDARADDLLSLRDYLRYAVSRFRSAGLSFGHGTSTALDDAAFLILEGLGLPIDELDPWLEARLTRTERLKLLGLIDARVETRKPSAYLLGRAYIQGLPFNVDERVLIPRSFLGELMARDGSDGTEPLFGDPAEVGAILELCTGSGCLAILASQLFPHAEVDATDISPDALAVAASNVDLHAADRVSLHQGDLYAPVAGRRYDLIIANPPYVDAPTMERLPAEYRHEPALALAGGPDGLDLVRRIIDGAADHLLPGGGLLCEIGTDREILESDYPDLSFLWLDSEESEGEVFWLEAGQLGIE